VLRHGHTARGVGQQAALASQSHGTTAQQAGTQHSRQTFRGTTQHRAAWAQRHGHHTARQAIRGRPCKAAGSSSAQCGALGCHSVQGHGRDCQCDEAQLCEAYGHSMPSLDPGAQHGMESHGTGTHHSMKYRRGTPQHGMVQGHGVLLCAAPPHSMARQQGGAWQGSEKSTGHRGASRHNSMACGNGHQSIGHDQAHHDSKARHGPRAQHGERHTARAEHDTAGRSRSTPVIIARHSGHWIEPRPLNMSCLVNCSSGCKHLTVAVRWPGTQFTVWICGGMCSQTDMLQ
jgi:hypothetical protein